MSFISAPSEGGNTVFLPVPDDIYELFVKDVEIVDNPWYNPAEDKPNKAKQFKWTFHIREGVPSLTDDVRDRALNALPAGEREGKTVVYTNRVTYFTGMTLGKHQRNKFVNLLKSLNLAEKAESGFDSEEEFKTAVIGANTRGVLQAGDKYNNITAFMKSNMERASMAEILEAQTGGSTQTDEDIPF